VYLLGQLSLRGWVTALVSDSVKVAFDVSVRVVKWVFV